MAGILATNGYNVVLEDDHKQDADVWVLNSCTVKGPSEVSFVNAVKKGMADSKKVIAAGCVPQGGNNPEWDSLSIIGVQQIDRVVEVVEESLKGNVVKLTRERKTTIEDDSGSKRKAGGAPLDLPKIRRNPLVEIIPINTGCLNQCTYCKTKHARGDLGSYDPKEICKRVEVVIKEGVKEIWLTSEDTGAHGIDLGITIVDLLWDIIKVLGAHPETDTMLRVGMTNPPYILEHLDEMVKILSHPRVFSFLHVPVQSGSDRVLSDMKRQYSATEFQKVVDVLRNGVEGGCTIATDVICGFPTEQEEDFEDTMVLLRRNKFTILHISQFYPRPGTPAARLQKLPSEVVKNRSRAVTAFFNSYFPNEGQEGAVLRVLPTEISSDGLHYVAHDKLYRQILVPLDARLLGQWINVRVVRTGKFFMEAELVDDVSVRLTTNNATVTSGPKLRNIAGKLVKTPGGGVDDDGAVLSLGETSKPKSNQSIGGPIPTMWQRAVGVGMLAIIAGGLVVFTLRKLK